MAPSDDRAGDDELHVVTSDPERAAEVLRRGFPGIGLRATRDGPGFRFDYHRVSDDRFTANRLRLVGAAEGHGSLTEVVAVGRTLEGRLGLEYGRDRVDTTNPYLRPPGHSVARMEDVTLELLELEPTAFARAASLRLADSGHGFLPSSPATAGPASPTLVPTWERISDHAAAVAFDPDAFASPLIRAGLFDLVVSGLLATFPLTAERGAAGGAAVQPSAIRRALAYIDDHLAEPIDVVQIAAAARVSVRGLQAAFRRHLGVTPMEQVRLRRLAAVRQELAEADGTDGVTVAAVARRWGFAHLPRFAQRYRAAYGESPSATLRR